LKKHFETFTRKPGLWFVAIIILGLLVGMLFLDVLTARQMKSMIGDTRNSLYDRYVRQCLIQGVMTAVVMIILTFLIANERARFQILKREAKTTANGLERYAKRQKRSEGKYRSLVESADDIIYTMDKYCNVLSINQGFSKLLGQPPVEVIGKSIQDVVEYDVSVNVFSIVEKVLNKSETFVQEEQVKMGGKPYWLNTKYQAVGLGDDVASLVLVISRDITNQKRIDEQLFHTEKLASLGALSAGVAHEINNPIAIILGFTELLMERLPKNSKEYEMHKTIQRQGNNCKRIVGDLLSFSHIPDYVETEMNIAEHVQRVVNLVMNTLVANKIDLRMDIEPNLPKVRGHGQQLEQVFVHLINNAVASMADGGALTLSAHRSGDEVRIVFTDTGCGITPEIMDKTFEPFFTTKEVGQGTGLGLSVSYGIVKMFGGDIRIESQTSTNGKEPGTTVTVTLPVAKPLG